MIKKIATKDAPAAVGPYSQAIAVEHLNLIFSAGQIALLPETGEIVSGGIEAETHQVFKNLAAVLASADSGLAQVVKATVYLSEMENFQAMNEIYQEYFSETQPARSTVAVKQLPKNALVEIEVIALTGKQD